MSAASHASWRRASVSFSPVDGVGAVDYDGTAASVANFSIHLPEATIAIQVSGILGSRQEEAQRLGRVLRPKQDGRTAHFDTVVIRDTVDQEYAAHRRSSTPTTCSQTAEPGLPAHRLE